MSARKRGSIVHKRVSHHKRQWPAGLDISVDELSEDVEADLVVGYSLNDADWQSEHKGYEHG